MPSGRKATREPACQVLGGILSSYVHRSGRISVSCYCVRKLRGPHVPGPKVLTEASSSCRLESSRRSISRYTELREKTNPRLRELAPADREDLYAGSRNQGPVFFAELCMYVAPLKTRFAPFRPCYSARPMIRRKPILQNRRHKNIVSE